MPFVAVNTQKSTKDKAGVKRKLKSVIIMISGYYFYFTVFIDDENVGKDSNVINDCLPTTVLIV